MSALPMQLGRGLGVLVGVVATTMAYGQQSVAPEPLPGSVHRMTILEGANRSVHYIASGNISIRDRLTAADLEHAENELIYVNDLQQLKRQYVTSERSLEPRRRYVQGLLYGRRISSGGHNATYANYVPNSGYGVPGTYGYNGFYSPYYHGGYGHGYGAAYASRSASAYSEIQSLQFGMGNEGVLKNAIAPVIARQVPPDYAAAAVRDYESALARAADSPVLSRDLQLHKKDLPTSTAETNFTKGAKATIWVGSDKYVGTVKDDRPSWVVIQTDKAEVTVRKSEITRSEVPPRP